MYISEVYTKAICWEHGIQRVLHGDMTSTSLVLTLSMTIGSGEARVPLELLHLETVLCHSILQCLYLFWVLSVFPEM